MSRKRKGFQPKQVVTPSTGPHGEGELDFVSFDPLVVRVNEPTAKVWYDDGHDVGLLPENQIQRPEP